MNNVIMKINNNKKTRFLIMLAFLSILMVFSNICCNYSTTIIILLIFTLCLVIDAFFDLENKYLLLLFYFTFFVFTMGVYLFKTPLSQIYFDNYSDGVIKNTANIQFTALLFLYLGFTFFSSNIVKKYSIFKTNRNKEIIAKRIALNICLLILIILFVLTVSGNFYIGKLVRSYGYLSIYNGDLSSKIPEILIIISQIFPIAIFISLSIFKSKMYISLTIALYFLYLCTTLLKGSRGEFSIGLLIIIAYLYIYQTRILKRSIPKMIFIVGFAALPLLAISLNVYNTTRNNVEVKKISYYDEFCNFFINQSNSVNVIANAQAGFKDINQGQSLYTIGPVINNIYGKLNKINKDLNFDYSSNTALGKDMSIYLLGIDSYNAGNGVGSQYLAELYLDYGYIGIIFFNFLLGGLILLLSGFYTRGMIGYTLSLLTIQSILYIPRGEGLQFINAVISLNLWSLLIVYSIIIKLEKKLK